MVKCLVQGCQNRPEAKGQRKRFFSFPADPGRVKVWLAALRESERFSKNHRSDTYSYHICEDHFLPEHITPSGIHPEAIPITPPLEGALNICTEEQGEPTEPPEPQTETPASVVDVSHDDDSDEDDDYDDDDDDEEEEDFEEEVEEEEEDDIADSEDGPSCIDDEAERAWLARLQENLSSSTEQKRVRTKPGSSSRADVTLGRLTKRFMDLLHSSPEGILDLNEAAQKLGTRKRRVYDITNVLNGIKLVTKKSKNKIQWVGPTPINCFKGQWKSKVTVDLLNLKSMEEALDWLIKNCAHQLFTLTDLKINADLAYVTYEDICQIGAFQNQTVIAVKAPEETKLEVPTPTEDAIQIHLKGCRGPIHVLTCETDELDSLAPSVGTTSAHLKKGHFLTLEESRIQTASLLRS